MGREAELLAPFLKQAKTGGILVVGPIKRALATALWHEMALATARNVLHRTAKRSSNKAIRRLNLDLGHVARSYPT